VAAALESPTTGRVSLPDGRELDYRIVRSARARSARLRISVRDGLTVVVPNGLAQDRVIRLVADRAAWIAARLAEFESVRHLIAQPVAARPQAFDLAGIGESWRVEYRATKRSTVAATTDRLGRIVVQGAIDNVPACHAALRRWLARRAAETLPPWLEDLAAQFELTPTDVAVKNQRTRWGSCARSGRISLNCKLLFLPRELVRYVLTHELCHLVEHNHSSRFWAQLRAMDRAADAHHGQMRDAWKHVPPWALRGSVALL
jgi:predicted metal-dependent hydrolase